MTGTNFAALRKDATTILEGEFGVVVKEAAYVRNSKGNPMLKVKLTVEQGPYVGRILYTNMNFTPDSPTAQKILFSQFDVLGLGEKFFDGLTKAPLDEDGQWLVIARELVGRRASVIVGPREWNGQKREEVQAFKAPIGQPNREAVFNPGIGGQAAAAVGGGASSLPAAASGGTAATSLPSSGAAATLPTAVPAQEVSRPATGALADPFADDTDPPATATSDVEEVELPF